MSEGKRTAQADVEDLERAPFLDEEERAEAAWLLARDKDPAAPPPAPALQREYAVLEDLLGRLPAPAETGDWQQEVLRRAKAASAPAAHVATPAAEPQANPSAPPAPPGSGAVLPFRRRATWWAASAALVAAAAVLAIVLAFPRPAPPSGELTIELRRGDLVRGDPKEAAVGDVLVIRGRAEAGDLRVFRADGALVGRCPDGPGCTMDASGERSLEIKLDQPTEYRVILVTGTSEILPGMARSEYLEAVHAQRGAITLERVLEVH